MKILVTGGTGFIGSHLVERLIKKGHNVKALVRKTSNTKRLEKLNVELIRGDMNDKLSIEKAVKGADAVFHLASSFRNMGLPKKEFWNIEVNGTRNILEASSNEKVKRFIYCSTINVVGNVKTKSDERSPYNPEGIYAIAKAKAEKLVMSYYKEKKLPITIIRPAVVYGPNDKRLLKLFRLIKSKKLVIFGKGLNRVHPVFIRDLTDAFELCLKNKKAIGNIYTIGGPQTLRLKEWIGHISKALNVPAPKIYLPFTLAYIISIVCECIFKPFKINPPLSRSRINFFKMNRDYDISKAKKELNFIPKTNVEQGIKETVQWYKKNKML